MKKEMAFYLTFNVHEGERYKLNNIKITNSLAKIDDTKLLILVEAKINKVVNTTLIEDSMTKITDHLSDQGFTFAEIDYKLHRNEEKLLVDLEIIIGEAKRTYVNKINISGNTKTQNDVILREMRLHEKDVYSSTKLKRSNQRLEGLDYFKKVGIDPIPSRDQENAVDLNIKVEEKPTSELNLGLGAQTKKGIVGQIGFQERNLLGSGREAGFSIKRGGHGTGFDTNYIDPYFRGLDILMGINLYLDKEDTAKFQNINLILRVVVYFLVMILLSI